MVIVDIFNIAKRFKRPLRNVITVHCMSCNAKLDDVLLCIVADSLDVPEWDLLVKGMLFDENRKHNQNSQNIQTPFEKCDYSVLHELQCKTRHLVCDHGRSC